MRYSLEPQDGNTPDLEIPDSAAAGRAGVKSQARMVPQFPLQFRATTSDFGVEAETKVALLRVHPAINRKTDSALGQ